MRPVAHCPACQTQFFVTEAQLNQHRGQVRCGHCLHVFSAKEQIVASDTLPEDGLPTVAVVTIDEPLPAEAHPHIEQAPSAENTQTTFFDDSADKSKLKPRNSTKKLRFWLLFTLILLLTAITQSLYFLRNEIAIYYPNTKPYLVRLCKQLACNIILPKKIEFFILDDYAIQEDTDYLGLMRVSSTLINQAKFNQAYPNVELTLTDATHQPMLRRIFKPNEYLAENTNIANGLAAGEEAKINLAITIQGATVAGYRLLVTY